MGWGSSYFDAAARIGGNEYVPTDQDILRSRIKTTGLTEERFQVGQVRLESYRSKIGEELMRFRSCNMSFSMWEDNGLSERNGAFLL